MPKTESEKFGDEVLRIAEEEAQERTQRGHSMEGPGPGVSDNMRGPGSDGGTKMTPDN